MDTAKISARATVFRALHNRAGTAPPLILPNVWDAVSARVFADAGFPALATSSAAIAATLGHDDGEGTPPDEMFAAVARIARSVRVPVTADVEAGYGLAPAEIVDRLLAAEAAGCNLEDSRDGRLEDPERHATWLAEVCAAAAGRLVVNARVDTYLFGDATVESVTRRARLYAEAGADVVYPILAPAEHLPELAGRIGHPINALCLPDGPSPGDLGNLGAARVTFGDGLHQRATRPLRDLARTLAC